MPRCLIGLGSNLGDRREILNRAVSRLQQAIPVVAQSRWFTYPAVGGPTSQGDFLNGAVLVDTELTAVALVALLHELERDAGRKRTERWAARTLDCDLLLYGKETFHDEQLQVPHPRMIARRFVLEPAAEIAADMEHPGCGWTIDRLLLHLRTAKPYFAIIGSDHAYVARVAAGTSKGVRGRLLAIGSPSPQAMPVLEFARQTSRLVEVADFSLEEDHRPLVSDFWFWQPLLENRSAARALCPFEPTLQPKLLMVTDPASSDYAGRLANLAPQLRVPAVFLSCLEKRALQDAVGAVLSMN